ncbi:RDD family protein [Carnobacterium pleistocenium]|uniref:RDD family protein n=1 Tax=Carnobacterium pleistocenium TaxID=181073 RepID=UPI00068D5BA4|nr:RDD family protein [Carnobacterium pleistocenium]
MTKTPEENEQKTVQPKKDDTKEIDLNEFKKTLAIEEAEIEKVKRLKKLAEKKNEPIFSDKSDFKSSLEETKIKEEKPTSPQNLRDARRKYWQEKQKEEERQQKPFHNFPSFFYVGFWLRVFAFSIDVLVIWSINRLIVQSLFLVLRYPLSEESFSAFSLSKLGVYLLYFVVLTKLTNGQTIGKIIFGIRVISFKEETLSWGTVLIRECFGRYILKTFPFIYLMVLFTHEKQHLADFFSDTSVVSENLIRASELSLKEQ